MALGDDGAGPVAYSSSTSARKACAPMGDSEEDTPQGSSAYPPTKGICLKALKILYIYIPWASSA